MVNAKTKSGNPYGAVITSTLLVSCFLFIQSLNEISKLCSIFFLLSYFGVNASCLCLDWAAAPNFRPTFKVSKIAVLSGPQDAILTPICQIPF